MISRPSTPSSPRRLAAILAAALAVTGIASLAVGRALAWSHQPADPGPTMMEQRDAMSRMSAMDGTWRGTAWMAMPSGERQELVQTERVGLMLDGTIRVIEGRGYDAGTGKTVFNAFAIVSYRPSSGDYSMRSYADGREGDFAIEPTEDGFRWSIEMDGAEIRYTATVTGDRWVERGERVAPGREPFQFFEMDLRRVGDTEWPSGGGVPMKPDETES